MSKYHKAVLLKESIEGLNIKSDGIYVDATLGGGGHSSAILEKLLSKGRLIVFDIDQEAIKNFETISRGDKRIDVVNANFNQLKDKLEELGISSCDGILADLGVSSHQIDEASRGFGFADDDTFLDMRLDQSEGRKAMDFLNNSPKERIFKIIHEFGEIGYSKSMKIARAVLERRKQRRIEKAGDLKEVISKISNKFSYKKDIQNIFRAIRMEVNQELSSLEKFLPQCLDVLNKEGRLCIISFHSLEDRIVKNYFRQEARGCICSPDVPVCQCNHKKRIDIINKKVITPGKKEIEQNFRSRSAKLRIVKKI